MQSVTLKFDEISYLFLSFLAITVHSNTKTQTIQQQKWRYDRAQHWKFIDGHITRAAGKENNFLVRFGASTNCLQVSNCEYTDTVDTYTSTTLQCNLHK